MDTVQSIFKTLESLGIQDEFIVLSLAFLGVAYFLYKQNKLFHSYHKSMRSSTDKLDKTLSALKEAVDKFDTRCDGCEQLRNNEHTDSEVQRETFNEKLDNLEDHMKEVKKQLLFK